MTTFVITGPVEFSYLRHMGQLWPIARVEAPTDMPRGRRCPLIGADVVIDGMTYLCVGVESHKPISPIAKGEYLGLMLEVAP